MAMRQLCRLAVSAALCMPLIHGTASGAIRTETVEYKHDDAVLRGYLAWDDAVQGKRPGVLVVHEWWGLNDYPKLRARQLAEMGYVAFAADIYGEGKTADTPEAAAELAATFRKDPALLRARAQAGLDQLKANPLVDPDKVAAIGFCFGGTTVLELARSGAALRAVVRWSAGDSILISAHEPRGRIARAVAVGVNVAVVVGNRRSARRPRFVNHSRSVSYHRNYQRSVYCPLNSGTELRNERTGKAL